MTALKAEGYDIIQVDESLFNADHFEGRHWAHAGRPIQKTS